MARGKGRAIRFTTTAGVSPLVVTQSGTSAEITGLHEYDSLVLEYLVSASDTETGDILALWVQTSYDGGTTWRDLCRFPDVAGDATVPFVRQYHHPGTVNLAAGIVSGADAGLAANSTAALALGDRVRLKWTVTDAGAVNATFTFTCRGIARG